jgi:hypothetical protein
MSEQYLNPFMSQSLASARSWGTIFSGAGGAGGGATTDEGFSAGGADGSGGYYNNFQTSSSYVWSNQTSIASARGYCFGIGNADSALMGGGWDGSIQDHSQVWSGGSWTSEVSLNTQRRDTTVCGGKYDDCITAYGRNAAGSLINSSSTWDGSSWSAGATGVTAREHCTGAGQKDSCLAAGGYTSSASALVDEYDGSTWSNISSMSSASYGQSMAATSKDSAHVVGGYSVSTFTGVWDGSSWTSTTAYPISSTVHYFAGGGGSTEDHLTMGGYSNVGYSIYDETYLWDGSSWTQKSDLTQTKYAGAGDCTAR